MQNIFALTWGGVLKELELYNWPCNIVSMVKYYIVVQYYVDTKILLELICFLFLNSLLPGAKICALMAHIRYDLCTKGHSNHPNWPKSMLKP